MGIQDMRVLTASLICSHKDTAHIMWSKGQRPRERKLRWLRGPLLCPPPQQPMSYPQGKNSPPSCGSES